MAATAISAVWMVIAARQLPLAAFGDLVLLLGLGSLFLVLNDFGLPLALTEAVTGNPETGRDAFSRVLRRRLALGLLTVILVAGAYWVSATHRDPAIPLVFGVSVLASVVYTTATAYFRGRSRVRAESLNEVLSRSLVLVVGGWWLLHGGGLLGAVVVYAMADTGSAAVLGLMAWKATASDSVPTDPRRFSLRRVGAIALAATVGVIYYRVDLWLVAVLLGSGDVALYGSAYRVVEGLLLGATAVAALSVPHVLGMAAGERLARLRRLVGVGVVLTAPVAVGVAIGGGRVMTLLFGQPFATAGGLLRVLVLALVPTVVVTVLGPLAFLLGRTRAAAVFFAALVLNVGMNFVLIPVLGVQGAAWSTLACQTVLAAILWFMTAQWMSEGPGARGGLSAGWANSPKRTRARAPSPSPVPAERGVTASGLCSPETS